MNALGVKAPLGPSAAAAASRPSPAYKKKPAGSGLKIGLFDLDPVMTAHRLLNLFPEIYSVEERFVSLAAAEPSPTSSRAASRAGVTLLLRPGWPLSSRAVTRRLREAGGGTARASVVLQPVLSPVGSSVRYVVYTRTPALPVSVAGR